MTKDKYGRKWDFPKNELCPVCRQPDSCGDCNHKKLTEKEVVELGGHLPKEKGMAKNTNDVLDSKLSRFQKNVGRCPICGEYPTWFNDVPLRAFCWGPDGKPHEEWSKVITGEDQPYR
jgi:hypothetical protein